MLCKAYIVFLIAFLCLKAYAHQDQRTFLTDIPDISGRIQNTKNDLSRDQLTSVFNFETVKTCDLNENAKNDYYSVLSTLQRFFTDIGNNMSKDEYVYTCNNVKEKINDQIKRSKQNWKLCLERNLNYFANFVSDVLRSYIDFFCESPNNVKEYIGIEAKECRSKILSPMLSSHHIKSIYNLHTNIFIIPPTKKDMCKELMHLRTWLDQNIPIYCPEIPSYRTLSLELFDASMKTCENIDERNYLLHVLLSPPMYVLYLIILVSCFAYLAFHCGPLTRWLENRKSSDADEHTPINRCVNTYRFDRNSQNVGNNTQFVNENIVDASFTKTLKLNRHLPENVNVTKDYEKDNNWTDTIVSDSNACSSGYKDCSNSGSEANKILSDDNGDYHGDPCFSSGHSNNKKSNIEVSICNEDKKDDDNCDSGADSGVDGDG